MTGYPGRCLLIQVDIIHRGMTPLTGGIGDELIDGIVRPSPHTSLGRRPQIRWAAVVWTND